MIAINLFAVWNRLEIFNMGNWFFLECDYDSLLCIWEYFGSCFCLFLFCLLAL